MNRERMQDILEAYGADPARWPEAERDAAQDFLLDHPEILAEAHALEAELDALLEMPDPQPSELLQHRILKSLPQPGLVWGWRAPVAAAAALVIGVFAGFAGGYVAPQGSDAEAIYAEAFSGFDEDWTDWLGEEI
ncbi:hypothetical protein [Maricaulis sp.]|uniref:hypothetical protein n=1 Tax=Maricaulis sp. TaxID=1486257 RepID=UPI00260CEF71|nr:hypothetical protein [Maricaulis sp.]